MSGRTAPFGRHDGDWIAITELVQQAAALGHDESRAILRSAIDLCETIHNERADAPHCFGEADQRGTGDSELIVVLATEMEHVGALRLGTTLLEGLSAADRSLTVVELGRVLTLLARFLRKQGEVERSHIIYTKVARLGRSAGEPELIARAANGVAAIMQLRGDFAAANRWATRASRLAQRHSYPDVLRTAQHGLMVAAARTRDFDAALIHGWAAYKSNAGDTVAMDDLLTNLGQLLLDIGELEGARIAFMSVLSRTQTARIGLPALGGLAGASARLGDRVTLAWAAREVLRQSVEPVQPYQIADALAECAEALFLLGESVEAERCSASALRLAERFGYHHVLTRASAFANASAPNIGERMPLAPRARRVAQAIQSLDPGKLPERVVFAAVA